MATKSAVWGAKSCYAHRVMKALMLRHRKTEEHRRPASRRSRWIRSNLPLLKAEARPLRRDRLLLLTAGKRFLRDVRTSFRMGIGCWTWTTSFVID